MYNRHLEKMKMMRLTAMAEMYHQSIAEHVPGIDNR